MPATDHIKILLTGASGQIGRSVLELGLQRGFEVIPCSREQLDITDARSVGAFVRETVPGLVINAAAYTAVDKAESEPEKAFAINRDGAMNLARACAVMDVPLLHYSTDYVFDGSKPGSYREDDRVNPLGIYGASKLAGEEMIRKYCPAHIILRVSWVFSEHGTNFVKTMLRLGRERDKLHIVHDQHGCPTPARDIAEASLKIAQSITRDFESWGTYHYSSAPPTTWYEFSRTIFDAAAKAGFSAPQVHAITTADYRAPARRPLNGVLDNTRFRDRFGMPPMQWRLELERVIKDLIRAESR
jgi:dTDP-4-dehydrorhamnose reductase